MGGGTVDWAEDKRRKVVMEDQRRFLWRGDTVAMHAQWLGLRPGMSVLDVGCGQGYIGYTWWPFIGGGGSYTGVDSCSGLLEKAAALSSGWAPDGSARFVSGDARSLPFPDGSFDWTACQTVLMHAADPGVILSEMIRVTRPGGVVSCNEPDNLAGMRSSAFCSASEPSLEDEILLLRVLRCWAEGRRRLGLGDWSIGPKVPMMMQRLGLVDVDIRVDDRVPFVQPPYGTPEMQFGMEGVGRRIADVRAGRTAERNDDPMKAGFRECFFTGGGTRYSWRRYVEMSNRREAEFARTARRQSRSGSYFHCATCCSFFSIRGTRP